MSFAKLFYGGLCFDSLQNADFNPANLQDIYKQI